MKSAAFMPKCESSRSVTRKSSAAMKSTSESTFSALGNVS